MVLLAAPQVLAANALGPETSCLPLSRRLSALLPVLLCGVAHPVDPGVVPDGLMRWVDHDDLEPLVVAVLGNPVRVQDPEVADAAANTDLSMDPELSVVLEAEDT